MQVYVKPARRKGSAKLIGDQDPKAVYMSDDNDLVIEFEASGLYDASRYRYRLHLSPKCTAKLVELISSPRATT